MNLKMEPGDYSTNVLSFNNYAAISYDYFEAEKSFPPGATKRHLQRLELDWRQEGRLVHYDSSREGMWLFHGSSDKITSVPIQETGSPSLRADIRGSGLVPRDKGIYEPASLGRMKTTTPNTMPTPSSGVSPSSSLEASMRNARAQNARSAQQNSGLSASQESTTLSPGNMSASSLDMGASLKEIHEFFVSAVLGSMVYFLCQQQNFIPLTSKTMILADSNAREEKSKVQSTSQIELATLDISLTSLGTLVIKAHTDLPPGLQNLSRAVSNAGLAEGSSLCLAPTGITARYHSNLDDVNARDPAAMFRARLSLQAGKSSLSSPSIIKSQQAKCLEWLSVKGLNTVGLESGGWLNVQITAGSSPYGNQDTSSTPRSEDVTIVPWPALLCFQTSKGTSGDSQLPTTNSNFRDPLAFAEDWFAGRDERANLLSKRQKDRQAAEAQVKDQAEFDARNIHANIYSPSILRRGSNAGTMYPTPPDAPLLGATPNFDGNIASPGNPNSFGPLSGGIPPSGVSGVDIDAEMWTTTKKARPGTVVNDRESSVENDNLFGDSMDADMFGTDIIEADFDFFDVPDSVPAEDNVCSPTVPILPYEQDMHMSEEAVPFDHKILHSNTTIPNEVEDGSQHVVYKVPDMPSKKRPESPAQILGSPPSKTTVMPIIDPAPKMRSVANQGPIFKLSQKQQDAGNSQRRTSLFDKISFEDSVASVNAKYGVNGQFQFTAQKKGLPVNEIPLTGYLSGRRKARVNRHDCVRHPHIIVDIAPVQQLLEEPMDYFVESDPGSQASEQDDTSNTTEDSSPMLNLQYKRKWDVVEENYTSTPLETSAAEYDNSVGTPQSTSGSQMPYLDPEPAHWSLAPYFPTLEADIHSAGLSDVERIASAQSLADQAVSGTFRIPESALLDTARKRDQVRTTRELMYGLARAASSCLKEFSACSMRAFLEIPGIPVLNQGLRLPPRPQVPRSQGLEAARPNNPFPIPPPQLEVRRADTKLTILPSAVTFWENLGLGPSQGSKNINAVCAYPNVEGASLNADIFMDQMRSAYESSRFGNHDRATCKEVSNGLVSYSLDPLQQLQQPYEVALEETVAQLFKLLRSLTVGESNFVVYFVYPNDNGTLLVQICAHFQNLFEYYRKALSERKVAYVNELVLQLVPMDFIASHTTLAVPSPRDYFRVAMEVYDRCFDFTSSSVCPAIMLERPLPKVIDFKLTSNPSASVLQENTCFHIAYARSIDERWITAAWTDNRGTQQMTASYCLGRKNEPLSMTFSQVATEIWETTIDYISNKKIHWRIMVAKVGVMDPSEVEIWTSLATAETGAQASLTLITVHTDPSLRLLPAPTLLNPGGTTTGSVVTPGSTPQAFQSSILSPDVATTPSGIDTPTEPDGDSRLIDLTDQSWGAVLGHRLNNSNSLVDLNLALISGYLIKRGGMNNDQPPIVMEVNIVHSEVVGNPRTFHESLLKEVLSCYRGLGSLARVRGVVDPVKDVRPWHIAAAEKAVKALYMLM